MGKQPSNLNPRLEQLLQLLQQEKALYQSLKGTMEPEKNALLATDVTSLRRASQQKESILFELQALETQRFAVIGELAESLGCEPRALSLGEIARRVDEPHAERLRQAGDILKKLLKTLAEENRRQKEIFEHSLAIMREAFELLHSVTAAPTVYRRTGNIRRPRSTGNLVCNEV